MRARLAGFGVLLLLGCGTATSGSDGGANDSSAEAAGPSVRCVDRSCSGSLPVCCYDLSFTAPFIQGSCGAAITNCSQNVFTCDDLSDCPSGQRCCAGPMSINGMTETYALCRAQCSANDTELCDRAGPGRCGNGGYCCMNASDSFGFCAATQADCSRARDQ